MLFMILFAVLPTLSVPSVAPPTSPRQSVAATRQECPDAKLQMAQRTVRVAPQRLIDLPPGRLELTVMRQVDGCPIPAVLREGLGQPGDPDGRAPR